VRPGGRSGLNDSDVDALVGVIGESMGERGGPLDRPFSP
jgi:hypothetical protein